MTPKSFMTILYLSPYGEKSERAVDLLPADTIGDSIAEGVFRGTHEQDLAQLRRAFSGLREDTPIPQWDGKWEDETGVVPTLGKVFREGRLAYVYDPSGRTHGANGTLFVQPG